MYISCTNSVKIGFQILEFQELQLARLELLSFLAIKSKAQDRRYDSGLIPWFTDGGKYFWDGIGDLVLPKFLYLTTGIYS